MLSVEIKINDVEGLHARPASRLVGLCHRFDSRIMILSSFGIGDT